MAKISEIELIGPIGLESHDLAHSIHEFRLAVGCETHDLVFVNVMREAEILRQRLIQDAQRVWTVDPSIHRQSRPLAGTPGSAGKIAEAIDRNNDSFLEWRNMKGRRKMCQMMFNMVHLACERLARKIDGQ